MKQVMPGLGQLHSHGVTLSPSSLQRQGRPLSHVRLFAVPWTVAYRAPPSMEFSWQEYQTGLPFYSPGNLPDPGIKPRSPALQADALPSEPPGKPLFGEIMSIIQSYSEVTGCQDFNVCISGRQIQLIKGTQNEFCANILGNQYG